MALFRALPSAIPASVILAHRSTGASFALGLVIGVFVSLPSPARAAEFVPNPSFAPKADTYICPNSTGGAVDCYLDAVPHLYTMCRQVKSIEILEFGYEKSTEGTNGAKSEYCVDKHKLSMARPYQAALKEAVPNSAAVDGLRALQDLWLKSLVELKWHPGETDEQYKARVVQPYEIFKERANAVRAVIAAQKDKAPAATADKGKKSKPATPPPKTKSAT
jgi:hypothetical protein